MQTDARGALIAAIALTLGSAAGAQGIAPTQGPRVETAAQTVGTPLDATGARPLSAIDWLSRSLAAPRDQGAGPKLGAGGVEDIHVFSLEAPSADALGLLPAARTGLPSDLWGSTPATELAQLLSELPDPSLPAIRELTMTLLLAELSPPRIDAPTQRNQLYLARVDRLLEMGALDQAQALLREADATNPAIFRRRFDVALLLGDTTEACRVMERTPDIAPSYPARIFCLARSGNWDTAELTYGTGKALGQIAPDQADLIGWFLDPDFTDQDEMTPPDPVTPLVYKMMEAVGQPLPTATLPLPFAHADLTENNGWKAQLEAGERLARAGVLDPNKLLGLYTERRAAASGALWDRVSAVSALDAALRAGDVAAVGRALPRAENVMRSAGLEPILAELFGTELAALDLRGPAAHIARDLGLLTGQYEAVARDEPGATARDQLIDAIARGTTALPPADPLAEALARVFASGTPDLPTRYEGLVPGQLGRALLQAIADVTEGAKGDYPRLEDGLTLLRMAGLESTARRAAIELMVLEAPQ